MKQFLKNHGFIKDDSDAQIKNTEPSRISFSEDREVFNNKENEREDSLYTDNESSNKSSSLRSSLSSPGMEISRNTEEIGYNKFQEEMDKVYDEGFKKLNKPDFDFYEFFKGMLAINGEVPNNIDHYKTALFMAKTVNPNLTKVMLIEQSQQYLKDIEESFKIINDKGILKLSSVKHSLESKKKGLEEDLIKAKAFVAEISSELENFSKNESEEIDTVSLKIVANEIAYNNIKAKIINIANNIKKLD